MQVMDQNLEKCLFLLIRSPNFFLTYSNTSHIKLLKSLHPCVEFTHRGLVLGEVELLVEVDGEDSLHPVVGEPLAELVTDDE